MRFEGKSQAYSPCKEVDQLNSDQRNVCFTKKNDYRDKNTSQNIDENIQGMNEDTNRMKN